MISCQSFICFIQSCLNICTNFSLLLNFYIDSKKYNFSRAERLRNSLLKAADNKDQLPITYFFDYITKVCEQCESNEMIQESLSSSILLKHLSPNLKIESKTFLKNILKAINVNSGKHPQGYRYEYEFKMFCAHLYLVCGLFSYEILSRNLGILPSPTTLTRLISDESQVREGELNIDGVLKYFNSKQLPKIVWLSEDQTKIVERVRYNAVNNTLEGLTYPLNENGMPVLNFNLSETALDIKILLSNHSISSLMNIVMIQPMKDGSSAFCLLAYGTSNKFTAADVSRRWDFMDILTKNGFKICGRSGDGDTRILKTMKGKSRLSNESHYFDWFHVSSLFIYLHITILIFINFNF